MTRPHRWSKAIRDKRVPAFKRTREYIGSVRRLKFSKKKKATLNKLPFKLVFNEKGKLRKVLDDVGLAKMGIVRSE